MNSIVGTKLIFCLVLSVLLQSCLFVGSVKNTRAVKRIKNGNRSENFTVSAASNGKPNGQNYFGGVIKKPNQGHKCKSFSCVSMAFVEKRLEHLKRKLLNYYDKRSQALATSRDGIGFPSLEGALLSLAFLTFAVFLIDLIQQLLSRLRVGGAVAVNRPVAVLGRRRKRSLISPTLRDTDTTTVISSIVSSIENPRSVLKI